MVPRVISKGFQGEKRFVPILFAITRILLTNGLALSEVDTPEFYLPVPPGTSYTTNDIFVIPRVCMNISLTLNTTDNCIIEKNLIGCGKVPLHSNSTNICFISPGSQLKSSGPVDVLIRLNSSLLQVPPINQLAKSYFFRTFHQTTNEICEKLFIYSANDSATLNICSNEFLQINMSGLSDREVINSELSNKCFKKRLSVDDGLVLGGLSKLSGLQIISDRPVGVLYGTVVSRRTNKSCESTTKEDKRLINWHFLPLTSVKGKLFLLIPRTRSSIINITILGFNEILVRIHTARNTRGNDTYYNVTERLSVTFDGDDFVLVETDKTIVVQVNETWQNRTVLYYAQTVEGDMVGSPSYHVDHVNVSFSAVEDSVFDNSENIFTIFCWNPDLKIYVHSTHYTLETNVSYTTLENQTLHIYTLALSTKLIHLSNYSHSKCFDLNKIYMLNVIEDGIAYFNSSVSRQIHNFTVIDFESALKDNRNLSNNKQNSTHKAEKTSTLNLHNESGQDESFENISQSPDKSQSEKIINSEMKENQTVIKAREILSKAATAATTETSVLKPKQDKDTVLAVAQQQKHQKSATDINNGFKMLIDIVQSDTKYNDMQLESRNPPYKVDSNIAFTIATDIDGRNSLAVIISLISALAAVLFVILVFFLVEVFSRRRHIRNTRIRPSRSFY